MNKVRRIELTFEFLRVIIGIIIAFAFILVLIALVADNPMEAIVNFSIGPFQTSRRFGQIMGKFIPYVLSGCGMCFIYASGRFSLVGEGIVNFAPAIACMVIFLSGGWMVGIPLWINLLIIIVVCAVTGAVVGLIPALGREKLGANEMVISIMMNFMLLYLSQYILKAFLADRSVSYLASMLYPQNSRFPAIIPDSNFHAGFYVSMIGLLIACFIFYRSRIGRKIRIAGSNPNFARYSGMNIGLVMLAGQVIGGIFSGVAGAVDAFGIYERYQYNMLTNIGMDGLIVAVLARKQPIFVPFGAFLLAYIRTASVVLNLSTAIPFEFVNMMQAVLILFVAADAFLSKSKNKMIFKESRKKVSEQSKGA